MGEVKVAILQTPTAPLNLRMCGGLERVELSELEFLQKRGHTVKLFASKVIGKHPDVIQIRDLSWRNRYLQLFYYYNFGLKARGYDVYHGHFTPVLALLFPSKSLVHFHGWAVFNLPQYERFRERFHQAQYVFCSQFVKEMFRERYPHIPQGNLHVIYNGIDIHRFKPGLQKRADRKVKLCFYAGWIPQKGIYDVLEAARMLETRRSDFRIYYGGSAFIHYRTKDSEEIDRRVRRIASGLNTVELVGELTYEKLPSFLGQMNIGLMPSTYQEPFGLVALEMMASGLPVVAYRVGGIPESIVNGETGFLVENKRPERLAEAIEKLLDDEKLRRQMGEAARQRVEENFTWEKHVDKLLEVYSEVAKS